MSRRETGDENRWQRKSPSLGQVSSHRAHGAVGQKPSCSFIGAAKQGRFQPLQGCFFLTPPFIELHMDEKGIGPGSVDSICNYATRIAVPVAVPHVGG